ncbi:MAG TPA: cupin domain-containing protein [Thermoleophilaceae bacterium]
MTDRDVTFAALAPNNGERFQTLRRELGVKSFGINLITLQPRERGRVHSHLEQEEVFVVLQGELTLVLEDGEEHVLRRGDVVRVGPAERRQLVNAGSERLVLLALGGSGSHAGRDGRAWESWDGGGDGRPPQEVPLPQDLPADQ